MDGDRPHKLAPGVATAKSMDVRVAAIKTTTLLPSRGMHHGRWRYSKKQGCTGSKCMNISKWQDVV